MVELPAGAVQQYEDLIVTQVRHTFIAWQPSRYKVAICWQP